MTVCIEIGTLCTFISGVEDKIHVCLLSGKGTKQLDTNLMKGLARGLSYETLFSKCFDIPFFFMLQNLKGYFRKFEHANE